MMLCKWHRTGVKPAVDNLRYTMHFLAAFRTLDGNSVNEWTVQFDIIRAVVGHTLQFCNTADGMLASAFTFPYI